MDLAVLVNDVKLIQNDTICYLRDEKLNYTLPITFSVSETQLAKALAKEINYLIQEHCRRRLGFNSIGIEENEIID